jgi:hypothetical protein
MDRAVRNEFSDIPIDTDTVVLSEKHIQLNGLNVLLQSWRWDGVKANSLIFQAADVTDFTYEAIKDILLSSGLEGATASSTISRKNDFVFINFNFRY